MLSQVLGRRVGLEVVVLGQLMEIRRGCLGGDAVHHRGGSLVGIKRDMFALVLVQGGLPSLLVMFILAQTMNHPIGQWEDDIHSGRHRMTLDGVESLRASLADERVVVRRTREPVPIASADSIFTWREGGVNNSPDQ